MAGAIGSAPAGVSDAGDVDFGRLEEDLMPTFVGGALPAALTAALLCGACGREGRSSATEPPADLDVIDFKVVGSNCAGVSPVMSADDGQPRPAQSVLAHYYAVLELYRVLAGERPVFQTDVPDDLRSDVAYRTWQAKTVEILADVGETGLADRWYDGTFGLLPVGEAGESCERVDPPSYQRDGLLAHTGLLQAAQCGENSDGDPKFWEVRPLALLWIGGLYEVDQLVADGLAEPVTSDDHGPCLVWRDSRVPDRNLARQAVGPACLIAYRREAVTEAVVLDLESEEVVADVPVMRRAFTARGSVPLPNGLDQARRVLRSDQFAVATAIRQPVFVYAGATLGEDGRAHHRVRLIGHQVGPLQTENSLLRDEERQQIRGLVGTWAASCCAEGCVPDPIPGTDAGPGDAGPGRDAGPGPGRDAGPGPGRDAGPGPGRDAGPGPGRDAGPGPGRDAGPGPGRDAGPGPGRDAGPGPGPGRDAGVADASVPRDPPFDAGWTDASPGDPFDAAGPDAAPDGPFDAGIRDAGRPEAGPFGSLAACAIECAPEGVCEGGFLGDGLVVVVTDRTTVECGGDCPHPSADPPAEEPICGR
jgi:hypothetical protein